MRIVFLYTAEGQASPGTRPKWNPDAQPGNHFANGFPDEGYCAYLCSLVRQPGPVSEVLVVVESTHGCGTAEIEVGVNIIVLPTIEYLTEYLRPDDVIFCRHGFRTWYGWLEQQYRAGRWMLMYGANGGRERWRIWHVIFNDLIEQTCMDGWGRLNYFFRKPVNTHVFHPGKAKKKYMFMIGASHVHDKKGQWRGVQALSRYKQIFGNCPAAILPGRFFRGEQTNKIHDTIKAHDLPIELPGMLTRHELAERMRESIIFLHFGSGQGDRSAIEAATCGCSIVLAQPQYHNADVVKYSTIIDADNFKLEQLDPDKMYNCGQYATTLFGAAIVAASHRELYEFIADNKPVHIGEYLQWVS